MPQADFQRTSVVLLKPEGDQCILAGRKQHSVYFRFVEGGPSNHDGGKVQRKSRDGLENKMSGMEVGQRQCPTEIRGDSRDTWRGIG